jgi:hypothetical protein
VLLRDRSAALPPDAVRHVTSMLAISKMDDPYAGIAVVRELCDPASLAAYAWSLFERWQGVGYSSKEGWILAGLRWFGDDDTVRRLSPLIRAWPGEGGHARRSAALDVLAGIGSDVALMHLYGISQKVKFKGLKDKAARRSPRSPTSSASPPSSWATGWCPTSASTPTAASCSTTARAGSRSASTSSSSRTWPTRAGARRKDLPKPGAKDDEALATASYQRFTGLKKDVRTLASDQIARFELAMVNLRRWPGSEFRELFVSHPVLWHIVRRLVWATYSEDGKLDTGFRVAEDRSLASQDDDTFTLSDEATVGIAHPLHLGDAVAAWSDVFADYEILQPFVQLGRSVHALTEEERAASNLERFTGIRTRPARWSGWSGAAGGGANRRTAACGCGCCGRCRRPGGRGQHRPGHPGRDGDHRVPGADVRPHLDQPPRRRRLVAPEGPPALRHPRRRHRVRADPRPDRGDRAMTPQEAPPHTVPRRTCSARRPRCGSPTSWPGCGTATRATAARLGAEPHRGPPVRARRPG